jgi:hypothetical protein
MPGALRAHAEKGFRLDSRGGAIQDSGGPMRVAVSTSRIGSAIFVLGAATAGGMVGCLGDSSSMSMGGGGNDSGGDQTVTETGSGVDASRHDDGGVGAESGSLDGSPGDTSPTTDGGDDGPRTLLVDDLSIDAGTQITLSVGLPPGAMPGTWFNYDDGTGTMNPPLHSFAFTPLGVTVDDAGTTLVKGACESGMGYLGFGAGWGMTIAMQASDAGPDAGATHVPYDASRWAGIRFWAAIIGDAGVQTVKVGLPDIDTYSDYPGSACHTATPDSSTPDSSTCVGPCACDNNFMRQITFSTTWMQYQLDFDPTANYGIAQDPNWGYQVPAFDPHRIFALQFQVDGPGMPEGGVKPQNFPEICVGRVEFYK